MNEQDRRTCREELRARRDELIDLTEYDILDGDSKRALVEQVAAIDAALAAIDAPQPTTQGLDMPDGPGWWAWEGYFDFGDDDVNPNDTQRLVCEVVSVGMRQYAHTLGRGTYQVKSMVGKWYRLTMPWEASHV